MDQRRYDVIVTNLRMPGMTGWEVVDAARQRAPGIGFVMISGSMSHVDVERTHELGLVLLTKPVQLAKLQAAVAEVLRQGVASTPVRSLATEEETRSAPPPDRLCPVCSGRISVGMDVVYWGRHVIHLGCLPSAPFRLPRRDRPSHHP